MESSDSDESRSSEQEQDDPLNIDAEEEVYFMVEPHLKPNTTKEQVLDKLKNLGVKCVSHLALLEERHVLEFLSPVEFTLLLKKLKKDTIPEQKTTKYVLKLQSVLSPNLLEELNGSKMMQPFSRKSVLTLIGANIANNMKGPLSEKAILKIATSLANKYTVALGGTKIDETEKKELAFGLLSSILRHARYVRGGGNKKNKKNQNKEKARRFTVQAEAGLEPENDLPSGLPLGETVESQNEKREKLTQLYNEGSTNWALILKLMKETYSSQRSDINAVGFVNRLFVKWPFIAVGKVLQQHFSLLMPTLNMKMITDDQVVVLKPWLKYFRYLSTQKRTGKSKAIPETLRQILLRYTSDSSAGSVLIICVMCLFAHFDIDPKNLILSFDEGFTKDDIEASSRLPGHGKPMIATRGKNPYRNPQCYIIIEKRCSSTYMYTLDEAIHALIQSYFVFKLPYERPAAVILEFLQRKLYGIDVEGCSRIDRGKSSNGNWQHASPVLSSRYTTLMKDFQNFLNNVDIDL